MDGLDPEIKWVRVRNYHDKTLEAYFDLVGAVGCNNPADLKPSHIIRRMEGGTYFKSFKDLFPPLEPGSLLAGDCKDHPSNIQMVWDLASKKGIARKQSITFTTQAN